MPTRRRTRIGRLNMKSARSGAGVNVYGGSSIGASKKTVAIQWRNDITERENLKKSAIRVIKKKPGDYKLIWR